jgi:hypothetical protein
VTGHLIWCRFVDDKQRFGRVTGEGGDDTAAIGELPYPLGGNVGDRAGGEDAIVGGPVGQPGVAIGGDERGVVAELVMRVPRLVDECGIDITGVDIRRAESVTE